MAVIRCHVWRTLYCHYGTGCTKNGAAVATVAVIFGQLLMSILIDNFGWFGNEVLSFSPYRLGALICLGLLYILSIQVVRIKGRRVKYGLNLILNLMRPH